MGWNASVRIGNDERHFQSNYALSPRHRRRALENALSTFPLRRRYARLCLLNTVAAGQDAITEHIPSFFRSGEYLAEETYVADADVRHGNRAIRDFTESDTIVRFVLTRVSNWVCCGWERNGNDSHLDFHMVRNFQTHCSQRVWSSAWTHSCPIQSW